MLADLRNHLFRHLQRLSLGFYERNRAGALISRITNDVEALDQLVTEGVTSLVQNSLTLLGTAIILFFLDWRLALATLTIIPLLAVGTAVFRRKSARSYKRVRERLSHVTATLAEDIAGMRVLQAFTREGAARENFGQINREYRAVNHETVVQNAIYNPYVDGLSTIATAIVLGYGSYLVFDGNMSIGVLAAFLGYLTNFFDPVGQLSQLYSTFLAAVAALDKITDVLAENEEVVDADGATDLERVRGAVNFDGVRFKYATGPEVLHGIDLDVPPGPPSRSSATRGRASRRSRSCSRASTTRPKARSGSTASTCETCARSRCAASSGSCRRRASSSPARSPRTSPSAAPTRPATRSSRPRAPSARDEFIEQLEDGYDTQLGERGFRLSLGQRQLVAFAARCSPTRAS